MKITKIEIKHCRGFPGLAICTLSMRKIILKPLSHAGASNITKVEVDAAINAMEGLSFI